jgi:hypothetical protein
MCDGVVAAIAGLSGSRGGGDALAARFEATRVDQQGEPIGDPVPAPALPGCGDPLDGIPSGDERSFCWDVRATPGSESGASMVRLLITAIEDGREAEAPVSTASFLVGNTQLLVRILALAQNGDVLFGSFDLVDAEADNVIADDRSFQLEIEVDGSAPEQIDPLPPSEGPAELCALDPAAPDTSSDYAGPRGTRTHTFL